MIYSTLEKSEKIFKFNRRRSGIFIINFHAFFSFFSCWLWTCKCLLRKCLSYIACLFWGRPHSLTLSWQKSLSDRNQSIDLQSKLMDWFLYDSDLHHERLKKYERSLQKYFTAKICEVTLQNTPSNDW